MTLIKNNQVETDSWHYQQDDEAPTANKSIVTLAYWLENKDTLITKSLILGISVNGDTHIDTVADELEHLSLVAITIPAFADGRAYSLAKLLRQQQQFKGEIRAVGDVLPDQALYLTRVGFDALELADEGLAQLTLRKLSDFSGHYQTV
ncbi:MAG: oxidoreductase [Piscirickettsiaceae bacterium]|nr:MAG: oxidoreductase [Piscirickettsiaceae bacterium]PCI66646.1 MAG: oxidoreductase [Piscirickettsiaceae bacterium]